MVIQQLENYTLKFIKLNNEDLKHWFDKRLRLYFPQ